MGEGGENTRRMAQNDDRERGDVRTREQTHDCVHAQENHNQRKGQTQSNTGHTRNTNRKHKHTHMRTHAHTHIHKTHTQTETHTNLCIVGQTQDRHMKDTRHTLDIHKTHTHKQNTHRAHGRTCIQRECAPNMPNFACARMSSRVNRPAKSLPSPRNCARSCKSASGMRRGGKEGRKREGVEEGRRGG